MNTRDLKKIGIVLALATAPLGLQASTEGSAMEACADALIADLEDRRGVEMDYRFDEANSLESQRREIGGTYFLDVRDPAGMGVIARADCRVDDRARVVRLKMVPLDAADARVRARAY